MSRPCPSRLVLAAFAASLLIPSIARSQAPAAPAATGTADAADAAQAEPLPTETKLYDAATGKLVENPDPPTNAMTLRQLLRAGGTIGLVILALSMAMVALIVEHMLTIRRKALMPTGLADSVGSLLSAGRFTEADQLCHERPSFLGAVLAEGLAEAPLGYQAVEKSMEDASAEQAARLFRKIEYLSVIGTIAPMLGLLGTVWGMIVAFQEFATKINPPVSELAPGIYQALVTTLMGLGVAVPALSAFAIFRNRIDELVAESSLMAEHAWAEFKRANLGRAGGQARRRKEPASPSAERQERRVPPVAIERPEDPPT